MPCHLGGSGWLLCVVQAFFKLPTICTSCNHSAPTSLYQLPGSRSGKFRIDTSSNMSRWHIRVTVPCFEILSTAIAYLWDAQIHIELSQLCLGCFYFDTSGIALRFHHLVEVLHQWCRKVRYASAINHLMISTKVFIWLLLKFQNLA